MTWSCLQNLSLSISAMTVVLYLPRMILLFRPIWNPKLENDAMPTLLLGVAHQQVTLILSPCVGGLFMPYFA